MKPMLELPELGSKVQVKDRHGMFVVVYVNVDRHTADLLAMDGTQRIDRDIPLEAVIPRTATGLRTGRN